MDRITLDKEDSDELARNSLMAISQSTSEKTLNLNQSFTITDNANAVGAVDAVEAEDYRSDLISISCTYPESQPGQPQVRKLYS